MRSIKIINIGISGFPNLKTAPVHKCMYINKALIEGGMDTLVVNNEALLTISEEKVLLNGYFEGIEYRSMIRSPYISNSKIKKNLFKLFGKINEFFFLIKYGFSNNIDIVFFYTDGSFSKLIYYRMLSIILKFKLIIVYHEFRSDFIPRRKNLFLRINDYLFDNYFVNFVDAVLPISEFLLARVKTISKDKYILKLPPLVDFALYDNKIKTEEKYFLFCGSGGHNDIILFIFQAFEKLSNTSDFYLYLVIWGSENQMKKLLEIIAMSPRKDKIKIFSNVSSEYLISLYCNAKALLIPLKSDIRDQARFPQKIAEYVASGNPIVSTNYGEVKYYFKDEVTAFIADKYEVDLFANKLKFIIENPVKAKEVGRAGKLMGMEVFDYRVYTDKLKTFITEII